MQICRSREMRWLALLPTGLSCTQGAPGLETRLQPDHALTMILDPGGILPGQSLWVEQEPQVLQPPSSAEMVLIAGGSSVANVILASAELSATYRPSASGCLRMGSLNKLPGSSPTARSFT